jgi:hypothetical protein
MRLHYKRVQLHSFSAAFIDKSAAFINLVRAFNSLLNQNKKCRLVYMDVYFGIDLIRSHQHLQY